MAILINTSECIEPHETYDEFKKLWKKLPHHINMVKSITVSGVDLERLYIRFSETCIPWPRYEHPTIRAYGGEYPAKFVDTRISSTIHWFGEIAKYILANLES